MGRNKKTSVATTSPVFVVFFIMLVNVVPVLHLNSIPDTVLMPRLLLVNLVVFGFYLYTNLRKEQDSIDVSILRNPIILLHGGLSIVTLASIFWAINPEEGLFDVFKTLTLTMLVFTAAQVLIKSDNWFYRLTQLVVITSFVTSAIGFYQYLEYVLPDPDREIDGLSSALYLVSGIMGHKNQLSIALMLYIPFLIFGILRFDHIWSVSAIFSLGLNLLLIFILETRSVWVGTVLGMSFLIVVPLFYRKSLKINRNIRNLFIGLIVVGTISVGGLIVAAVSSDGSIHKKIDTLSNPENSRNIHRINTWKMSLNMSLDKPVTGVGAGNWKIVAPSYHKDAGISLKNFNWMRPHNDFLWMLTEKGIFGLLIFILIFFFAFYGVFKVIRTGKNADKKLFVLLISGGLVGYMVVSFFTFPVERIHHQVFLAIYLAAIIVSGHRVGKENESKSYVKKLIIAIWLISLGGAVYSLEMIRMERHLYKANIALNDENWESVIKEAKLSSSIFRNIDHDNIPVEWYLGMGYFKTGKFDLAKKHYKKAIKASPYNPVVLNNYGQLLVETGNYKEARMVLTRVLNLTPIIRKQLLILLRAITTWKIIKKH